MRIERHAAVIEHDLPEIYAFIAQNDRAAAERVLDAVDATLGRIEKQPESGVIYRTRNVNLHDLRMIPVDGFPNYLVFYRIGKGIVFVLYIVHGARHLPRLFQSDSRG